MLTALTAVWLSAAEVDLTPPPPPSPAVDLSAPVADEPDDDRGQGFLKHGYGLASLGGSMTLASAIGLGVVINGAMACRSRPGCFDEGGSAVGYIATLIPLALGLSMIAVAIPLLFKGLRERYSE